MHFSKSTENYQQPAAESQLVRDNFPQKYNIPKVSRNQPLSHPSNAAATATDDGNPLITHKSTNP